MIISNQRLDVKRNAEDSGTTEVYEEHETLLDDLILEIE